MVETSSESSEQAPARISNSDGDSQAASSAPYQLTVKRGFLALFLMYAIQTLVGVGFSYGIKFTQGVSDGAGTIDIQTIGMTSVLVGGGAIAITSLLFMAGHGPTILWPMYFVYSVAWGWILMHTRSLKISIAIHMLSNLFYTVVAVMGWKLLA